MKGPVKVVLTFAETDAEEAEQIGKRIDVRQLLRDALGEFIDNRTPVSSYMARRYGELADPDSLAYIDKSCQISLRARLGRLLKRAEVFAWRETQKEDPEVCTIYSLVLTEIVQLQAIAEKDNADDKIRGERLRLWGRVGYDVCTHYVVAANSEASARQLAFESERGDDDHDFRRLPMARRWLDPSCSLCSVVGKSSGEEASVEKVILGSFRNG